MVTRTLPIPIPILACCVPIPMGFQSHGNGHPIPMHISTSYSFIQPYPSRPFLSLHSPTFFLSSDLCFYPTFFSLQPPPLPKSRYGSGECCKLTSRVRCGASAAKTFRGIFSSNDCLCGWAQHLCLQDTVTILQPKNPKSLTGAPVGFIFNSSLF